MSMDVPQHLLHATSDPLILVDTPSAVPPAPPAPAAGEQLSAALPAYQGQPLVTSAVPLSAGAFNAFGLPSTSAKPAAKRPRTPKTAPQLQSLQAGTNADGAEPPAPKARAPRKSKTVPTARSGGSDLAEAGGARSLAELTSAEGGGPQMPRVINPSEWVLQIHPASQILFEKQLTHSDTNRLGRMVLPKSYAEAHFNLLDGQAGVPVVVADVYGRTLLVCLFFFFNFGARPGQRRKAMRAPSLAARAEYRP